MLATATDYFCVFHGFEADVFCQHQYVFASLIICISLYYLKCFLVCFAAFQSGGVDLSQPIVLTCGGAMVAPLVAFALSLTGLSAPVYDVSNKGYCAIIMVL